MYVFKRGKGRNAPYYVRFRRDGYPDIVRCTDAYDKTVAENIARKMQDQLTEESWGITKPKPAPSVPTLTEYLTNTFEPWVKGTYNKTKTLKYYENGVKRLDSSSLANVRLNEINDALIAKYRGERKTWITPKGKLKNTALATIHRELQVVQQALNQAHKDKLIAVPEISWGDYIRQKDENHRSRVITCAEEAGYLFHAGELLRDVVTLLVDTGMRPEEAFRLDWQYIHWIDECRATMTIPRGKTEAAERMIPMTPRLYQIMQGRYSEAKEPSYGWVFPAPTKSGHMEPSTLRQQHNKCCKDSGVTRFVIYDLRHTCLTRWGMAGMNLWTHAYLAGHSDLKMSKRYVHPGIDAQTFSFFGVVNISQSPGYTTGYSGNDKVLDAG